MKRQKKQMLILLVILLVLTGAAIGMYFYNQQKEQDAQAENEASVEMFQTDQDDITKIICETNGEKTLCLEKQEDTWIISGNNEISLDQDVVSTTLSELSDIKATRILEDVSASDYGFDSPLGQLKLTVGDQEVIFTVGMQNDLTEEYYLIKDNDTSEIYVTDDTVYTILQKTADDYQSIETEENE